MVTEDGISRAADVRAKLLQAGECDVIRTKGRRAIVAGQHTEIVFERTDPLDHCTDEPGAHAKVQVGKLQNGEAFEGRRQMRDFDVVMPDLDRKRVPPSACEQTGRAEAPANQSMDRTPVLDVKEVSALAKDVGLIVALEAKALADVKVPEARLECQKGGTFFGAEFG